MRKIVKYLRWLYYYVKNSIRFSVYRYPYSQDKRGYWPFAVWVYRWGIACHWRTIADMRLEIRDR